MPTLYVSQGGKAKAVGPLYCSQSGKTKAVQKLYYGVEGKTKLIYESGHAFIESLTYMQDCANYTLEQLKKGMKLEQPYTLIDSRDNTKYTIALLKDGNIWMCENLRIGSNDKTTLLTPADTNISENYTLPQGSTTGFDNSHTSCLYIDPTYGGYYAWSVATAGFDGESSNAPYSILPLGWRMPTGGDGGEFQALGNAYGSSSIEQGTNLLKTPVPGYVRSGEYYDGSFSGGGINGCYWSSTAKVTNLRETYSLMIDSKNYVYLTFLSFRFEGCSIRGICKGKVV